MQEIIPYTLLFITLFFEVFLLVSFLERKATRKRMPAGEGALREFPSVTIAVPCYTEETSVQDTMRSLLALEYPSEKLDILVVDDGSTDGTYRVIQEFAADPRVRIFRKENGGKHTAMNAALAHTNAELIGWLDADSIVDSRALKHAVRIFANRTIAAVTPGIHVRSPETLLQHMQHAEYRLSVFNRFVFSLLGSAFITPGPFSIFRTSVVRDLGGWRHGHSTEDMELALRMQEHGHLIANAPRVVVYTRTPRSIPRLFRQRVRWTYGFLRNAIDYRHMFGNARFGNLGLIVLPAALISIGTGVYFYARMLVYGAESLFQEFVRLYFSRLLPDISFDVFYINTSSIWFIIYTSIGLIVVLIALGSQIGTGRRTPPLATPFFLLLYGFLVPLWLGTALARAALGTGVKWR